MIYILSLVLLAPGPVPVPPGTKLIDELGSTDPNHREAASRRLAAMDVAALPALRRAARSHQDPEVRRTARLLLEDHLAVPSPPPLRSVSLADEDDVIVWQNVARQQLTKQKMEALTAGRSPGVWSNDECYREATYLMARAMLEAGCERWRVLRLLEALKRAKPTTRKGWTCYSSPPPPAETLARLEAALGLK